MKKRYVPTHLKNSNRKIIYDMIADGVAFSRASLSRESGISGPTILKIIDFFIEKGIVRASSGKQQPVLVGRTPTMLRFNPGFSYTVGIMTDGEYLKAGVINMAGTVITSICQKFDGLDLWALFAKLPDLVSDCTAKARIERSAVLGIGLGLPGTLDPAAGTIQFSPQFGILQNTDCTDLINAMRMETGLPVYLETCVNSAAWGEYHVRMRDNRSDMVYLSLGRCFGAGIILNGQLLRGQSNMAGDIDMLCHDPGYQVVEGKPGWMGAKLNIADALARIGSCDQDSVSLSPEEIRKIIQDIVPELALMIANINAIINSGFFVLGGDLPPVLGKMFYNEINDHLACCCRKPPFIVCSDNQEAGLQGLGHLVGSKQLAAVLRDEEDSFH